MSTPNYARAEEYWPDLYWAKSYFYWPIIATASIGRLALGHKKVTGTEVGMGVSGSINTGHSRETGSDAGTGQAGRMVKGHRQRWNLEGD